MAGWLTPRTSDLEVRGSSLARLQCAVTFTFTYIFTILNQILISYVISINKLCIILLFSKFFFKMPFALFVGTSNLHSVQRVRNRFVTIHQ